MSEISKEEFKKLQKQTEQLLKIATVQARQIKHLDATIHKLKEKVRQQSVDIINLSRKL